MIRRTILRVALVCGAIQLAGCAEWMRQNRENARLQRVQNRADDIVWKDLVPKFEFQHSCQEVGDAFAQFEIAQGYDIATQSDTQVVTAKRYLNTNGRYDEPQYQQTRVVSAALRSTGTGCRIEVTLIERFGSRTDSARAPNPELKVIEKLEPERAQAMRAEAVKRAEAEDPPEPPVGQAPAGDQKAAAGDKGAAATKEDVAPVPRKQQPPVKIAAEEASGPPTPPAPTENVITRAPASSPARAPAKGDTAKPWYFWTAATATVLFTAGAVVAGVSAKSKFSALESSCGGTNAGCSAEQIDNVRLRATAANVLWVLAGASAVVTGVTFFVGDREAGASIALRF